MELIYASEKVRSQCTLIKAAQKLFGGDKGLARSLLARINSLETADTLKDIIVQPTFHFHNLGNIKGRKVFLLLMSNPGERNGDLFFNPLMRIKNHSTHVI